MFSKVIIVFTISAVTLNVLATDCERDCSNSCQATCQRPRGTPNCVPTNTNETCQCQPGYFLSSNQGYCIPASDCEPHCVPYQRFKACKPCHQEFCPMIACFEGCYCIDGYELHPTEDRCVLKGSSEP